MDEIMALILKELKRISDAGEVTLAKLIYDFMKNLKR